MNKVLAKLLTALQYFPAVVQGVSAVESVMPTAPGADKKAVVLSAITAATKVGETVPEEHVQTISTLIDTVVAALNATGWFKKSTSTAAPAAPAPPAK